MLHRQGGVTDRLAELEERLRVVEQALRVGRAEGDLQLPAAPAGTWWVLERLAERGGPAFDRDGVAGSIVYAGRTVTPGAGTAAWQLEHPLPDVLEQDWAAAGQVLSALGHPVRLEIVRRLLLGARALHDLQQIPGLGTSGQLHHHLRELRAAGLVVQPRRNDYAVPTAWVVPCLVMVSAAAGPGGAAAPDPPPPAG